MDFSVDVGGLLRHRADSGPPSGTSKKCLDVLIEHRAHAAHLALAHAQTRLSTSWSSRLVYTPHTYACCTTAISAGSERRRGSKMLGK